MLPLETKISRGKLLPHSDLRMGIIQQQALQKEGLQRKVEGTTQLQDWNVEYKNLE